MRCEATRAVLLLRHGLLFLDDQAEGAALPASHAAAIGANLATLGYVPSAQLTARLSRLTVPALDEMQRWTFTTLSAALGGGQVHEPLFRHFPDDIPSDTRALWWKKVLVHFLGAAGQPCLFCHRIGTTHVLSPCLHVVCDQCFDGANYSACPVCGQKVDRGSPFFQPSAPRAPGIEPVRFKLIDIGDDLDAAVRTLLVSFCARTQAMSPDDVRALVTIVTDYGARILPWLPEAIPARENVAHVFGTLFRCLGPDAVLPVAKPHLKTATDVLRTIAAYSGADPSLQATTRHTPIDPGDARRWTFPKPDPERPQIPPGAVTAFAMKSPRFAIAKVKRPTRRALFALLESMPADTLVEDMLRHRSTWIWVGELLHPHEYAKRFPNVARAFQILRGKDPNGAPAPAFETYYGQVAARTQAYDVPAVLALLSARPGELARRLDHLLRLASAEVGLTQAVLGALATNVARFATPVLVALRAHFGARHEPSAIRVYWPKGAVTKGVSGPDTRDPLRPDVIGHARRVIDDELLQRFSRLPAFETAVVDDALRDIIVPFNERTASPSAVSLPRGSRVAVPDGKIARLFLHWCEPEKGGRRTDIDLSVAFYDANWSHVGTCSYYQLRCGAFAKSAGDLTSAPFPDGSTEFIDIDLARAKWAGVRHAVMVVNSFSGMTFSTLERGFAGLMLREDPGGAHFDPRTVALRFALQGENGIFMPLSFDIETRTLHWLDVYSKGQLSMNNVASSNSAIQTIVPNLIAYFGSGTRASMYELAAIHAAARARRVIVRRGDDAALGYVRADDETPRAFLARLLEGRGGAAARLPGAGEAVFAALFRRDQDLAKGSVVYALFDERAGREDRGERAPGVKVYRGDSARLRPRDAVEWAGAGARELSQVRTRRAAHENPRSVAKCFNQTNESASVAVPSQARPGPGEDDDASSSSRRPRWAAATDARA